MLTFWVYFRGTKNGEFIEADTLYSAKWIFALRKGLTSLAYIAGSKRRCHG